MDISAMSGRERAVVLVSGGMDSLVTAGWASARHEVFFLHIDYGQRTEAKELACFERIVAHFRPAGQRVIDMCWLGALGASALTDPAIDVPHGGLDHGRVPVTYVPFRNSVFLAAAVAWAEVLDARHVLYGAVEVDGSDYPDCRASYIGAYNRLIEAGTLRGNITVEAPLVALDKREIIHLGHELGVPFEFSWSCYERSDVPCGTCDSCRLRARAFQQAHVVDPLDVR